MPIEPEDLEDSGKNFYDELLETAREDDLDDEEAESMRDEIVALIVQIAKLQSEAETAGIQSQNSGMQIGPLFERVLELARQLGMDPELGVDAKPKQPDKSLSQSIMEFVLEVDLAVKELVPVRLADYRNRLAAEGLGEAPESTEPKPDEEPRGIGTMTAMAGINLADQAALQYHSMLLELAMKVADARIQDGSALDLDEELRKEMGA